MIPSAVNLPLSILPESLNTPAEFFQEKYGFPKPLKIQEITFYCRSGKRSASACDIAKRNGYTKYVAFLYLMWLVMTFRSLYNYEGSWLEWVSKEGKNN